MVNSQHCLGGRGQGVVWPRIVLSVSTLMSRIVALLETRSFDYKIIIHANVVIAKRYYTMDILRCEKVVLNRLITFVSFSNVTHRLSKK